jgi:polar amino acid transport system permease protein
MRAVPVRRPGRWIAVACLALVGLMLANMFVTNENFNWPEQAKYVRDINVLEGVRTTLWLTVAAMAIGLVLGVIVAVMRLSTNPIVAGAAWTYVWVFRGTPVLVQLLFWANIGALLPTVGLGVPFGPEFITWKTFDLVPSIAAALLGLGLNEAAYMSEIVRAGILSVDEGQGEAATALGFSKMQTLRRIVLPQAMRVIVPPFGNETISMLKTTSLVAYVPFYELLFAVQNIYVRTYQVMPMLIMVSLWYLFMSSLLTVGQFYIERHYAKGATRSLPPTPYEKLQRTIANVTGRRIA